MTSLSLYLFAIPTVSNVEFFLTRSDLLQEAIMTRFTLSLFLHRLCELSYQPLESHSWVQMRGVEEDHSTPGLSFREACSDIIGYWVACAVVR